MTGRRLDGAGELHRVTGPNHRFTDTPPPPERSPTRIRRPLGASLPPELRLVAFEAWIRAAQVAIADLEEVVQWLTTGRDDDGAKVSMVTAWEALQADARRLAELRATPFRKPRP